MTLGIFDLYHFYLTNITPQNPGLRFSDQWIPGIAISHHEYTIGTLDNILNLPCFIERYGQGLVTDHMDAPADE